MEPAGVGEGSREIVAIREAVGKGWDALGVGECGGRTSRKRRAQQHVRESFEAGPYTNIEEREEKSWGLVRDRERELRQLMRGRVVGEDCLWWLEGVLEVVGEFVRIPGIRDFTTALVGAWTLPAVRATTNLCTFHYFYDPLHRHTEGIMLSCFVSSMHSALATQISHRLITGSCSDFQPCN